MDCDPSRVTELSLATCRLRLDSFAPRTGEIGQWKAFLFDAKVILSAKIECEQFGRSQVRRRLLQDQLASARMSTVAKEPSQKSPTTS